MELDKTRIAIRERSYLDILDLALRVIREQFWPLAIVGIVGTAPWFVLNHYLFDDAELWAMLDPDAVAIELIGGWIGYAYMLAAIVLIETPVATALITLYLGQATFSDKINPRLLAKDFVMSLPQLLLLQLVGRALLIPFVVSAFFPLVIWPYLNEIILLERNSLIRRRGKGRVTTLARIGLLHGGASGDLFARAAVTGIIAPLLLGSLFLSAWSVRSLLLENWTFSPIAVAIYLQATMWIVACFWAVVRFLAYLDLRIRNEGWELELRMRAEGLRLAEQIA